MRTESIVPRQHVAVLLAMILSLAYEGSSFSSPRLSHYKIPQTTSFNRCRLPLPINRHLPMVAASVDQDKYVSKLDKEMEKEKKTREILMQKLNAANAKLQTLDKKKNEYLDGSSLGAVPENQSFTETTMRSLVKSFMWRIIAGSITFATALQFSKSMSTALSIVGSDFFSKSLTMFLGERLMNKSAKGRKKGADGVGRSLAKALIWRLFAICNTLTMSVFFAKDLKVASKIAGSDAIFKTGLMFVYERVWAKVEWGKEYVIDFYI